MGGGPPSELPDMDQLPPRKDDRRWARFAHLAGPVADRLSAGPLAFVGPLIVGLVTVH
jgi:hypothetical protein